MINILKQFFVIFSDEKSNTKNAEAMIIFK